MNKVDTEKIECMVNDIQNSLGIKVPIYGIRKMEEVVEVLGGVLRIEYNMPIGCRGYIQKKEDTFKKSNTFKVTVSASDTEYVQKYNVAYQIGHLFIHMGYLIDEDLWKNQTKEIIKSGSMYNTDRWEDWQIKQAKYFANAFLMPKELFEIQVRKETYKEYVKTCNIARHFDVTNSMASERGQQLGLFRGIFG